VGGPATLFGLFRHFSSRTVAFAAMSWNISLRLAFALAVCASLVPRLRGADRAALAIAAASITKEEVKGHVDTLADDTFEGRETGSRGGRAAGNYVLKAFEQYGAIPAGDSGTYFQSFSGASRNILGLVEGSDARLKQQTIVVGAHYDHVGYGRSNNSFGPLGYIHNGADDNASGVAGLLELLDAVKRLPTMPKRSLLFAAWDGEEGGLNGSRHWVGRPTIPLSRVAMAINLDMIGRMRNDRLEIYGARTAPGLRRLVSEANGEGPATIVFDWKLKADSDHWPFYERRIPFLMFHTGLHGDYHRPSDDANLINNDGLAKVTKIIFWTAMQLADADDVAPFREAARQDAAVNPYTLGQPATPQPPRFGMPFRIEPGDPPKIVVTDLTPGSPAEKSGIKAGDRLLEFQGQPITDEARLRLQLLASRGETTFLIQRPGTETPLLMKITPSGEPVRVGITWRWDDGEPGTVIVTQVIYGSAAHAAGVRLADRIYSVGDRPFRTQEEFVALLTRASSPLNMLIERDGKLHNTVLTLVEDPPAAE
jgi:peptidase M28-like protein/PDZ domain-containing protein